MEDNNHRLKTKRAKKKRKKERQQETYVEA
jgi:hypothetical protein